MLIRHPCGLMVDPELGFVYGLKGKPLQSSGYVHASILIDGVRHRYQAHRLIWEAVHGPIPERLVINHLNAIKNDNRIANLECVTQSENMLHAYSFGCMTAPVGSLNGHAKITEEIAAAIRDSATTRQQAADTYGLSYWHVRDIRRGKYWKNAQGDSQK